MKEGVKLNIIEKCMMMFYEPSKAFEVIESEKSLKKILLVYYVFNMISSLLVYHGLNEVLADNEPNAAAAVKGILYLFTLIVIVVQPLLIALFYHVVAMILGYSGYLKTLKTYLYSAIISTLGITIARIITIITGDYFSFTPMVFLDSSLRSELPFFYLESLDLFSIWSLIVFGIGLTFVHQMKKKEAMITIIVPVILSFIILTIPFLFKGLL